MMECSVVNVFVADVAPHLAQLGLIWRPIFSWPQIALAAIALLALTVYAYARSWKNHPWANGGLLLMRLMALAALVVLLLGPSETPPSDRQRNRTDLAVLLDLSESMLTEDCAKTSRLDAAHQHWLNAEQMRRLADLCRPRLLGFGETVRPMPIEILKASDLPIIKGSHTHLARSLHSALSSLPSAADATMLVLSDGHDTEDADLTPVTALARARGITIHAVAFGSEATRQDVAVLAVPMQDYLLPGETGALRVRVYQSGLPNARTELRLRGTGLNRSIPLQFNGRAFVEQQLEIQAGQPGDYEYQVSVDALREEVEVENNQQVVFCRVQERRIRVLMLEGQPYWDTKFIAQSLRKDDRIELTQITQVAPDHRETLVSRARQSEPRVPENAADWSQYDVVILGGDLQQLVDSSSGTQLADFVLQQGGHVVLARGRCYDPSPPAGTEWSHALSAIEPVVWDENVWSDVVVQMVPSAVDSSWLAADKMGTDTERVLTQLPGLQTLRGVSRLKPATRVIARANSGGDASTSHPAIVSMSAGRGEVVALLSHDAWRWSLRPPDDESTVSFYDTFWSNLVRWLVMGWDFQPGHQASLQLSRRSLTLSEELDIEVVFKDPGAADQAWRIVWTDAAGQDRELSLQRQPGRAPRFRTRLTPEIAGVHTFALLTPDSSPHQQLEKLNVYDINLERLETSSRPARLRALAEATGGRFLPVDQPQTLLQVIERQKLASEVPAEPRYVWDQAVIMTLLLAWCGGEWLLRRLAGLL